MDSAASASSAPPKNIALIAAYREEQHIAEVVRDSLPHVDQVWVVDDGSPDQTAKVAQAAGAKVLVHEVNRGKGAALKTGLRAALDAGVELVVLLDGDGQHLPAEIPRFIEVAQRENAGLVIGNRLGDMRTMPWIRRQTNLYMSGRISRACGAHIPDTQCGFRLLRRDVIPSVLGESERFDFETEMLLLAARTGCKITSVPVSTIYGEEQSKINPLRDTIRFFKLMRRYEGKNHFSRQQKNGVHS